MKVLNKVLCAVNVVLVCILAAAVWRSSLTAPHPAAAAEAAPAKTAKPDRVPKPRGHSDLESAGDWRQWIEQLRAAGVPTPVLVKLVQAGFDDRWMRRQAQADLSYRNGELDADDLGALAIQHDRERDDEVRAAIGDAAFKSWDIQNILVGHVFEQVTLTGSESNSVYDAEKKLQRLSQDANELKLRGQIDQAECDSRLQKGQTEHDQQLKSLLGDQRYTTLYPPPPESSEPEHPDFRARGLAGEVPLVALLDIQRRWNEMRSDAEDRLQAAKAQRSKCEDELETINNAWEIEFQRVLGTNTYNTVQKENDGSYKEMKRYAAQWSLDDTAMDHVYRTVQYFEKARADYERKARALEASGEAVDWDGVRKNIQDFGVQMQQSLQSYLGQEKFDRLKYNNLLPFARRAAARPN
jgi:hypothetical protein